VPHADAIIVGSGLTGGWAARQLSEAGYTTIVVEAGPQLTRADLEPPAWTHERTLHAARRQAVQCRHPVYWSSNPRLFVDDIEHPYAAPRPYTWIRGRQVGGRSVLWGGVTLRWSEYELRPLDVDNAPTWPITYADLAPHYDIVEDFLKVQGRRDGLRQLPDGRFEAPPSMTPAEERFKRAVEKGWPERTVIAGRGIPLDRPSTAEWDSQWPPKTNLGTTLHRALATGRTTIRADSIVSHLVMDPGQGRALGVAGIDRRTKERFALFGRVLVLCASTIESIRILLNSRGPGWTRGVGNSSGFLGRGLTDHMVVWASGIVPAAAACADAPPFGGPHGILVPRFRNVEAPSASFAGGYGIWGGLQRRAPGVAAANTWFLNAILEVLPRDTNVVEIDPALRDAWDIPVPAISFQYSENEARMQRDAQEALMEMACAAGLKVCAGGSTMPGEYVHELGGARMGSDPATSVLTRFNQCWDAPNVFVVDGACFPTAGWQNPALTMMALTVRACAQIARMLGSGAL
jgi:choline dehydrogenase-like flavoprotein